MFLCSLLKYWKEKLITPLFCLRYQGTILDLIAPRFHRLCIKLFRAGFFYNGPAIHVAFVWLAGLKVGFSGQLPNWVGINELCYGTNWGQFGYRGQKFHQRPQEHLKFPVEFSLPSDQAPDHLFINTASVVCSTGPLFVLVTYFGLEVAFITR